MCHFWYLESSVVQKLKVKNDFDVILIPWIQKDDHICNVEEASFQG